MLLAMVLSAAPLVAQDPPPSLDPSVAFVTTGGAWTTASAHGHYRIVVLNAGWEHVSSRLMIQWVEESAEHRQLIVRDTRMASVIPESWSLGQPQFVPTRRGVKASISGTDTHSGHAATWTITLGPPGVFSVSPDR
jgi:hypothetical protein